MSSQPPRPSQARSLPLRRSCDALALLLIFALPWAAHAGRWAIGIELLAALPLAAVSLLSTDVRRLTR